MEKEILNWIGSGKVGASSKAMALCIADANGDCDHPHDPADFNRCLLFLEAVPAAKQHLSKVRTLSPTWAALVDRWHEVQATFVQEVGWNWSEARSAPKTYELMKQIGC